LRARHRGVAEDFIIMTHPALHASPQVITTANELRAVWGEYRDRGGPIGLVPTMGALHEGHLSLVRAARRECRATMVTIFVNPAQFGPKEDLAKYPRPLDEDLAVLTREGVDLVFVPPEGEIYPPGFSTFVQPPDVARPWEGTCRPGHFRGVATVVLKLFHLIPAEMAFFGQKDYQQCLVIRRMVADLDLPLEIRMCPTVREPDGLAMSSRNRYLAAADRVRATAIARALGAGRGLILSGERRGARVRDEMNAILAGAGIARVDYVTMADPDTLAELDQVSGPVVLLIAAYVGETRLIDNCLVG
jgi:pantoate--beta-alanine ligase